MELSLRSSASPPGSSHFLFGGRGTGKWTWCMHQHTDAVLVDLLAPDALRVSIAGNAKAHRKSC